MRSAEARRVQAKHISITRASNDAIDCALAAGLGTRSHSPGSAAAEGRERNTEGRRVRAVRWN